MREDSPRTTVEFRPTCGPTRRITVSWAQWLGKVCALGKDCGDPGSLQSVGDLCDSAEAAGSLGYLTSAYAHLDCLRPAERCLPSLRRCALMTAQDRA